jgi:hypothetical protein
MTPNLIPALVGVALVYGAGVVTAHGAELLSPPPGAQVYCATVGTRLAATTGNCLSQTAR